MQKYKAIKTEYGYLIIKDKKSNNYLTALYYDGKEVVASSHEIYSRLPSFDVPEEWEEDEIKILWGKDRLYHRFEFDSFTGGYNAAKKKYKWTDEDMERAYQAGEGSMLDRVFISDDGEDVLYSQTELDINKIEFFKSLQKQKEYEVELEEENGILKITNNKVKILSWKEIN